MSDIVNVRSTIAANGGVVVIRTGGMPVVGIELEGTWVGTLHLQETVSGDGFVDAQVTNAAGTPVSAVVTGNGKFFVAAAGRSAIQVIATAWTSGTATVIGVPTEGSAGGSSGGGGGAVTIADGGSITFGAQADAAATTDTGTFSFVSLFKRGLQKFTTLLGVLPAALVGGRLDVNLGAAGAGVSVGVNKIPGTISSVNSSTATLTSGAVFTGTAEDVSGFAAIIVNVFADVAGTLAPQFSSDGTHWDMVGSHAIVASTGAAFLFRPSAGFFRLVYTNGGTNQGAFRLQTIYHLDDVDMATAQALGAGLANPTTIQVGADLMVQTGGGTSWAPAKADTSNRIVFASDDGSLNTLGTTTDAGIITDANGTGIGFLRGAIKMWITFLSRLPAALVSGRLDVNLGAAPAAVTIGTNAALVTGSATIGAVTQASGPWTVQGAAAAGAALAGNPVRVGISDGSNTQDWKQAVGSNAAVAAAGVPVVEVTMFNQGSGLAVLQCAGTDAQSTAAALQVLAEYYNGATLDKPRNNIDVTVLTSAARTTTQSGTITTYNLGAIKFILDMTVITAGPSVTLTISETDLASGKTVLLLSGAAVVTAVTNEYTVDPVVPAVANVSAQKRVPRTIFWQVTPNNANSGTYSLGSMQLPA